MMSNNFEWIYLYKGPSSQTEPPKNLNLEIVGTKWNRRRERIMDIRYLKQKANDFI